MAIDLQSSLDFRNQLEPLFDEEEIVRTSCKHVSAIVGAPSSAIFTFSPSEDEPPLKRFGDAEIDKAGELASDCIQHREILQRGGLLAVPLADGDSVVGALVFRSPSGNPVSEAGAQALASVMAASIRRARRQRAYKDITNTIAEALKVEQQLELLLESMTKLGFEYAIVSVADPYYRQDIADVRAKNVPPATVKTSFQNIHGKDIVAKVYQEQKRTKVLCGMMECFDEELHERFDDWRWARMFLPIFTPEGSSDRTAVGVLEIGCAAGKKDEVFVDWRVKEAERVLANTAWQGIELARRNLLLERVARHAMEALGAGSASISVRLTQQRDTFDDESSYAGAGKATKEFLRDFRMPEDYGKQATMHHRVVAKGADDIRRDCRQLYDAGVRALLAVPLRLPEQDDGILYLHFWGDDRHFSDAESRFALEFAQHVEIAISTMLLLERNHESHERSWAYSRLLAIIQALPKADLAESDLRDVLTNIAMDVVQLFGADNVVLWSPLDENSRPILKGYFHDKAAIGGSIASNSVARWLLDVRRESLFAENVNDYGQLLEARGRQRFVEREKIVSMAALLLKDQVDVVGIMFVNYRQPHSFADRVEIETLASAAAIAINTSRKRQRERRLAADAWKEFSGMAAHRIGTEAADIRGAHHWLREDLKLVPELNRGEPNMTRISDALGRIDAMVLEFTQFATPPAPKFERLNINELCRTVATVARDPVRKIRLSMSLGSNVPPVWGDHGRLLYAFKEILQNAIKAMPDGGELTMTTKVSSDGRRIRIDFVDSGPGVPPDLKQRIFEPGYRARPDGTGLGLAIVRKTITEHNGSVEEVGEHGKGAHFTIELAAYTPEAGTCIS